MSKNENLHKAKTQKNDEFYTQYEDIQLELNHYEKHFEGKTVLCNCDDPYESNFCKFFLRNFNYLKLKRLICTSYSTSPVAGTQLSLFDYAEGKTIEGHGFVLDVTHIPMRNGRGVSDDDIDDLLRSKNHGVKELDGIGDFRSEECIEYLKQADIVVTNCPFSLFREYVSTLIKFDKKFLIIGNQNALTYKEIFPLIKENKMWLGVHSGDMAFQVPDYYEEKATRYWQDATGQKWRSLGNVCWFTNLDIPKRHEDLILYEHYYGNEAEYPKYDNYDAINVDKVTKIPVDYVPCWFNCPLSNLSNECEWALQEGFDPSAMALCENLTGEKYIIESSCAEKCNGVIGVPITFLDKYSPSQFILLGIMNTGEENAGIRLPNTKHGRPIINGKELYLRVLIRRKQ